MTKFVDFCFLISCIINEACKKMDSLSYNLKYSIDENFSCGFGIVGRIDTRRTDLLTKFEVKDQSQELKFQLAFKDVSNNYEALLENIDRSVQYKYLYNENWNGWGQALFRANGTNAFDFGVGLTDGSNKYNISGKWDDHEISGDLGFTHTLCDDLNVGFSVGTEKFGISTQYQYCFNTFKGDFEVDKRGKKFVGLSWSMDL